MRLSPVKWVLASMFPVSRKLPGSLSHGLPTENPENTQQVSYEDQNRHALR